MCIAIVKPAGVNTPSKNTLLTCWTNNPNGAGFCYNDGKKVTIHKGFMDFKSFYKEFSKYDFKNCDVVIHFRIATHGGVNKECTHPFVISKNIEDLKKLDTTCKSAFIHNGIISGYGDRTTVSDTMDYVIKIIANIPYINRQLLNNLATEKNSRFAILNKNCYVIGGKWIKDGGLFYSNDSYKPRETPQKTTTTVMHKYFKPEICDFCGKKTYLPRTAFDNRYGDTYTLCWDCYNAFDYYLNK